MNRFQSSGRMNFGGGSGLFPPAIKVLLILNVAIFLLQNILGPSLSRTFSEYFALFPLMSGNMYPWQLVTYQFLHADFGHIFFNMFALWMFGMELEHTWGTRRFITYYLLAGIGAGIAHLLVGYFFPGSAGTVVGASGAINGILIGFAMMFPDRPIMMFPFFIPIPAKYLIMLFIGIDLFSGLFGRGSGVAHFAHLGGGLTGFLLLKFGDKIGVFSLGDKVAGLFSKRQSTLSQPPVRRSPLRVVHQEERTPKRNAAGERTYEFEGEEITQTQVDEILDKINQVGYQALTAREKNILFEVSKRLD
jgi:membrane associated rhomboid family serine protease